MYVYAAKRQSCLINNTVGNKVRQKHSFTQLSDGDDACGEKGKSFSSSNQTMKSESTDCFSLQLKGRYEHLQQHNTCTTYFNTRAFRETMQRTDSSDVTTQTNSSNWLGLFPRRQSGVASQGEGESTSNERKKQQHVPTTYSNSNHRRVDIRSQSMTKATLYCVWAFFSYAWWLST